MLVTLPTMIAVFENIIAFAIDLTGCSRKKASLINMAGVVILSLSCTLGFAYGLASSRSAKAREF